MDDRNLLRYGLGYRAADMRTQLDWSAYPGVGGGFQGAVEMCNNNGACRSTGSGRRMAEELSGHARGAT